MNATTYEFTASATRHDGSTQRVAIRATSEEEARTKLLRRGYREARDIKRADLMSALPPEAAARIATIARLALGFETLETRNSDSLDFKDTAVWAIKEALEAAYVAGARDYAEAESRARREKRAAARKESSAAAK